MGKHFNDEKGDRIEVTKSEVRIRDGGDEITVRRGRDGSQRVTITDTGSHSNQKDYVRLLIGVAATLIISAVSATVIYACNPPPAQSANAIRNPEKVEYALGESPLENKVAQNTGAAAGGVESRLGLTGNAGQSYGSSQMRR